MRVAILRLIAAVDALSARAWLALGYAGFLIYAFPGYMSTDSVVQLLEGRSGNRADPHPPFMAAEWGVLDLILSGPLLMLLLQGALFLLGTAAIFRRAMAPRAAAIAATGVLWFPPVLTVMGVIWKDAQMAGYLIAGTALLIGDTRRRRLLGLALIAAGCAFRYNAFAAAVPLVFALFAWRPGLRWFQRYAIAAIAAACAVGLAISANRALTVNHAFLTPSFADIVGVLAFTHDRSDEDLREVMRDMPLRATTDIQAAARRVYSARNPFGIDHGADRMFDAPSTELQRAATLRAWKAIVTSDWRAYFEYRLAGFRELIGYTDNAMWSPVYNVFLELPQIHLPAIEHGATWSGLQERLGRAYSYLAYETPLYRPYIYIAIALVLLVLCCRDRLTFALFGSGLTYELSFFPAAGTPDYRYSHWMITTTCIAVVVLFAQRRRGQRIQAP